VGTFSNAQQDQIKQLETKLKEAEAKSNRFYELVQKLESEAADARREITQQKKLIQSLIKKVPEKEMTDEEVKNVINWLGIDIEPAWAKVKQALTKDKDGSE